MAIRYTKGDADGGFTPLPVGTYDFKILEQEEAVSNAGNPQLKVRFEVLDGVNAGRQLNQWFSFAPKAVWALEALFAACGIEPTDTGEVDENDEPLMEVNGEELVDMALTADVSQNEWPANSGKFNNRLNKLRASEDYPNYEDDEPEAAADTAAEDAAIAKREAKEQAPHPSSAGRRRRRVTA